MRARSARHVDWLREVSEAGIVLEALLFFRLFGHARCGLHVTFIGGVERGQKNISILSLESIARALGVSMAELISGIERRTQR